MHGKLGALVLLSLGFVHIVHTAQYELYYRTTATWIQARETCVTNFRNFSKITSNEDLHWIKTLNPYVTSIFWIGLRRDNVTGKFLWSDATELTFTNWAKGFPVNDNGLDCVRMRPAEFSWENVNCTEPLNFLCENSEFVNSVEVSDMTKVKGILLGLGVIGGGLLVCCLLLQLPCCRVSVTDKIAFLGFGTKDIDGKPYLGKKRDGILIG